MKSLAELEAIRQKTLDQVNLRREHQGTRVVVGMATCGIAAGARPVMMAFLEESARRNLSQVHVTQTGCIGMCRLEPMADVMLPGREKVTYVHLNPEKVSRIVAEHIVNGQPVKEYTIGGLEDQKNG